MSSKAVEYRRLVHEFFDGQIETVDELTVRVLRIKFRQGDLFLKFGYEEEATNDTIRATAEDNIYNDMRDDSLDNRTGESTDNNEP